MQAIVGACLAIGLFSMFMLFTAPKCPEGQVPTLTHQTFWACVVGHNVR